MEPGSTLPSGAVIRGRKDVTEKTKIRVALDTSALRTASLSSGPFEALARLAEAGYVEVFIPEVAVSEFNTLPSKKQEAKASLTGTVKTLKKALPSSHHDSITELEAKILKTFDDFEETAKVNLAKWMERAQATVIPVGADHGKAVIDKYFTGTPPFKAVKNRNDFPDGFIVEAILEVTGDGLLVSADDEGVKRALADTPNIEIFDSVADLLDSDFFDDLKSDVETDNVSLILALIRNSMDAFVEHFDDELATSVAGTTVTHYDAWNDETDTLYIEIGGPVTEWNIDPERFEYLGEGVISVPFEAVVEVSVDTSTGDDFHNDVYGTSEEASVALEGWMSIIVYDPSLLREPIDWVVEELLANVSVSFDDVSKTLTNFERGQH